jgi:hypothetical protein
LRETSDVTNHSPCNTRAGKVIKTIERYEAPRQVATGVHHVMVKGQFALEKGAVTGNRFGRVLHLGVRL